jgi:hypothetical protein
MARTSIAPVALIAATSALTCFMPAFAVPQVTATRLAQNPLVTVDSSASLGGNVNGPTVIRVPGWVERPLGRYYMYFANHMGTFIRLAYADAIAGPWRIYEPGVVQARDTAFFRPQPDPVETLADFYTHVASPEIFVDTARQRLVMWIHGWWTNGERWPSDPGKARAWARQMNYGQYTQAAESTDGVHFELRPAITRHSYLRVFQHDGVFYGLARLGQRGRRILSPPSSSDRTRFATAATPTAFATWGCSSAAGSCTSFSRRSATRRSAC